MRKQQVQQEIAKAIERDHIISYKKKATAKLSRQMKDDNDEIESANSLKSNVFSEDNAYHQKKNTPLPELNREKQNFLYPRKKNFPKHFISQPKQPSNYFEKEVRLHDNLVLKQKNNHLTTENMKLKTKVMSLERENDRLNKIISDEPQKIKKTNFVLKDSRFKGSEIISLKMAIKNLRKQLDQQKKENEKIKWSIKFTTIHELQCERDQIFQQAARLKQLLEQEQAKKVFQKMKQQGLSHTEHKIQGLNEKCTGLMRENSELKEKLRRVDEENKKGKQAHENEKNLNKLLFNARRVIKDKDKQIQTLKMSIGSQKKIQAINSSINEIKSSKEIVEKRRIQEKRAMSKSAQKYRNNNQDSAIHQNYKKLAQQNKALIKQIDELKNVIKKEKEQSPQKFGDFSRHEIQYPSDQEMLKILKFLTFRFKAHHLELQEALKYLVSSENIELVKDEQLSVLQITESLVAEPFSLISSQYLETCILKMFYPGLKKGEKVKIDESKKLKKGQIVKNFENNFPTYEIMKQQKEEQMFIQVAQLITNYHQHILTALNRKRNGEGTISEQEFIGFFQEIQLEKEFIDFITVQIILESFDLDHLNYYTMFEIFYMPVQQEVAQEKTEKLQPGRKKFELNNHEVVKEEDEQYEESKSVLDVKQKTQSAREENLEEEHNQSQKIGQDSKEQLQYQGNFEDSNKKQENEKKEELIQEEKQVDSIKEQKSEKKEEENVEQVEDYNDDFQK